MKNNIILLSPLLLFILLFFVSCCKEDICVNKLKGKYICKVNGTIRNASYNDSFNDSVIIQNISFLDDSQMLEEMTIDKDSRIFDTLIFYQSENSKDSILFRNYNPFLQRTTPIRTITGFFYLKTFYMSLMIMYNPTSSINCNYNGKKKII